MSLNKIRLELGRTDDFPDGNRNHGYEFVAPLKPDGHLDAAAWKETKEDCTVHHFENGGTVETGLLRHAGRGWHFEYARHADGDDEPFFKLDRHIMRPGLYVSIVEHDGVQRPFKIVSVMPVGNNPSGHRT